MPSCFCYKTFCSSIRRKGHDSCHMFSCPPNGDIRKSWEEIIPKKNGAIFNVKNSKLCHLHFEEKFVIKQDDIKLNGVVVSRLPRKKWLLTPDAVPSFFCESVLKPKNINNDKLTKKRKPDGSSEKDVPNKSPKLNEIHSSRSIEDDENQPQQPNPDSADLKSALKSELINDLTRVQLQPNWQIKLSEDEQQPFLNIMELGPLNTPSSSDSLLSLDVVRLIQISHSFTTTVIEDFAEGLQSAPEDNTFASVQTLDGLRVTLKSVMELSTYLIEKVGFNYVLTAKFNQDVLEKFFGLVRSFNGDNDHPSITSFSYLFRLLSIYNPLSNISKGNIRNGEECVVTLTTFINSLKHSRSEVEQKNRQIRDSLKSEIAKLIPPVEDEKPDYLLDHTYARPESTDCVIYKLSGYLAFKSKKFSNCEACVESLCSVNHGRPEALLTNIKSCGKLSHPSDSLFSLIKTIEPKIEAFVNDNNNLAGPVIVNLLQTFGSLSVSNVGCKLPGHVESLLSNVISYYLSMRMFFYTKIYNRETLVVRAKAKRDRKKVKLN